MAGAAIIVSLQQLKAMLGIVHFTTEMGIVPVMASVFHHSKEWSWQTILMGISFLIFLLVARHVVRTILSIDHDAVSSLQFSLSLSRTVDCCR